jgi:hypothetical protein
MRAEKDAKRGERVQQVEASRIKRIQTIACQIQALYPPFTTTTPLQYRHNGRRLESRWSQVRISRQHRDSPELGNDGTSNKTRRLIVGFDSQLQPLHGSRRPCCPPLPQGGQEIARRAQRRDGTEICQVGGALYKSHLKSHPTNPYHATDPALYSTTIRTLSLTSLCLI